MNTTLFGVRDDPGQTTWPTRPAGLCFYDASPNKTCGNVSRK
ncbi:hypothetical protein VA596_28795 [Amycolatopsis sp., V23-08]|uniref:Uncharacterized protein n=1 Tax=Amycolatopsis heterodermiae TaxID=3110235 RepID=A0ABU5REF3_9PSEU|nr:hypothetical protein [Amycolatopsis sp., V23-08]MEA5363561.1 hypothetical protein [Amycolatopsis sp., V23-08]